uniref:CSON005534 protein n=1 Tax=Culicoides sonorensis TaxID=179676 RepID=A0A336LV96_CULSO
MEDEFNLKNSMIFCIEFQQFWIKFVKSLNADQKPCNQNDKNQNLMMMLQWVVSSLKTGLICVKSSSYDIEINPEWERPDAWSRHRSQKVKELKENISEDYEIATERQIFDQDVDQLVEKLEIAEMYYKRLAKLLFNVKRFKEIDSGFHIRTIQIKIEKDRLDLINALIEDKNSDKISELDEHILTIIRQSEPGIIHMMKEEILGSFENLYYEVTSFCTKMMTNKTIKLLVYATTFLLIAYLFKKRWGCNLLITILILMFSIGYGFQYLQCNSKMEMEQIIAFKKLADPNTNPCTDVDLSETSYFSYKQTDCINYMRSQSNIEIDICLPHVVLIEFLSHLYENLFEKYFISTTQAFTKATADFGYIGQIFAFGIFMVMFMVFGKIVLGTAISSIFQYGFGGILSGRRNSSNSTQKMNMTSLDKDLANLMAKTLEQNHEITKIVLEKHLSGTKVKTQEFLENRIEDVKDGAFVEEQEEFEHVELKVEEESESKITDDKANVTYES